jgi:uncharacterized protein DUF4231
MNLVDITEPLGSGGMDAQSYLKERVEDQIAWYDRKAAFNKRWFISLRTIEIAAAAIVPFLSGFMVHPWIGATVGVIGIVITLCAGVTHLCQFQERWVEYRSTAEALKKERFLFVTRTEPYHADDAFPILVQRIETVASKENVMWAQHLMKPERETEKSAVAHRS